MCVVSGVHDPQVASLTGTPSSLLASVSRLFVVPAARGRGVAEALLGTASSHAATHGLRLMLDVVDDGSPAVAVYERLGWRLVDCRTADWTTPAGHRLPVRVYLSPEGPAPLVS